MIYLQGPENPDYNSNRAQTWITTGRRESGIMRRLKRPRSVPGLRK